LSRLPPNLAKINGKIDNWCSMNRHERGLEFKVGAFVFVGLAMLGALVVQFGRLGEGFKTYYGLTVRFSDASGLLKGSDVLLAGARIGKVSGGPRMVPEGQGVDVPLKIYDHIKIPEGSKFTVGSSGLLGASMEHLNQATTALAESSKKLDGVIDQAGSTMTSAKEAADNLQSAIDDTRKVLRTATQGKGLVATLLNNQQLANDLHALISNLRAHGVLFYRDSAATTQTKPQQQTKPARQTRDR
jgi:phospholipid/cholesterol/gamma-HCH transport system substrate-binding protein